MFGWFNKVRKTDYSKYTPAVFKVSEYGFVVDVYLTGRWYAISDSLWVEVIVPQNGDEDEYIMWCSDERYREVHSCGE